MAETSSIPWTDATVNFWWGCTKVSPACDNCYAEAWNAFRGNKVWGPNAERRVIKGARALLGRINRDALNFRRVHGRRPRIFMHSMSDVFDNEVGDNLRFEALNEAAKASQCHIQIVTKRVSNVEKMVPAHWLDGHWPAHIGLMVSICNQREAKRDLPRLIQLKRRFGLPWIGVSMEPLLERTTIVEWAADLDWVIVGGESGKDARPLHSAWVTSIMRSCQKHGTAFFFKQWGTWMPEHEAPSDELVADLRRRRVPTCEMPANPGYFNPDFDTVTFYYAGKKQSGALLGGQLYRAFPEALLS